MAGSCKSLGFHEQRCVAHDRPELQDNPRVWWDTDLIKSIVAEYVRKWDIDAVSSSTVAALSHQTKRARQVQKRNTNGRQIITFDEGGVSGHINHRAVSAAVR